MFLKCTVLLFADFVKRIHLFITFVCHVHEAEETPRMTEHNQTEFCKIYLQADVKSMY